MNKVLIIMGIIILLAVGMGFYYLSPQNTYIEQVGGLEAPTPPALPSE